MRTTATPEGDDADPARRGSRGGRSGTSTTTEIWEEDESGEWRARRDWSRFTPAKRIPVDEGLELRSRRGAIGESWWSRRFLSAVESILTGGRLTRGRTYARQGQVIDLGIGAGLVVAQVQGTRRTPYGVQITMPAASDERWAAIVETLAGQAGYAARLLAGELPHEIEDVFAEAGVALFPERGSHLITSCTCPDWATPCKHAAAVCYLMAEAFDDDPFLLARVPGPRTRGAAGRAARSPRRTRSRAATARTRPPPTRRRPPRPSSRRSPPSGTPVPTLPMCTACLGQPRCPGRCCDCCPGGCSWFVVEKSPTSWKWPMPGWPPRAKPVPLPARRRPRDVNDVPAPTATSTPSTRCRSRPHR